VVTAVVGAVAVAEIVTNPEILIGSTGGGLSSFAFINSTTGVWCLAELPGGVTKAAKKEWARLGSGP
jgi:hypothetical protein